MSAAMSLHGEIRPIAEVMLPQGLPTREQILRLQESMLAHRVEPNEPMHYFAPGMYLRALWVPADQVIVGKIHKHTHFLAVLAGHAAVTSEFGRMEVKAGHISVSPAGVKRVVLGIENTLFVTIHLNPTNTQDLSAIEAEHIEPENIPALTKQELLHEGKLK